MPPKTFLLLFDGDCGFCRRSVHQWEQIASEKVCFEPYQTPRLLEQFPETSLSECRRSVVLIDLETRGKWTGAEAVFRVLATNPNHTRALKFYKYFPLFAPVSEAVYRLMAGNRTFFSKILK